jgi:hypothetical protein
MDEANGVGKRRSHRSNVLMTAALELADRSLMVKLRNLSAEGALVEADGLPVEGSDLLFRRSELCVAGKIAWVMGNHAGVAFSCPLEPDVVLRHVPRPKPRVNPRDYKRPAVTKHVLSPVEQRWLEHWMTAPSRDAPGE